MAVLPEEDRARIWRGLQRYWSNLREGAERSGEIRTTVDETDGWINANQASYVSSLTYGGSFSAMQLTLIFCCVALARVSIGFLRRVLGEVD